MGSKIDLVEIQVCVPLGGSFWSIYSPGENCDSLPAHTISGGKWVHLQSVYRWEAHFGPTL